MKTNIHQLSKLITGAMLCTLSSTALASTHSIVIAIDGLRGDGITNAATPNIDTLIQGTWAQGYHGAYAFYAQTMTDAAPNSGPNHVGIMTGVTSTKSGVTGNSDVGSGRFAQYPHYQSLLERQNSATNTVFMATWATDFQITNEADLKINTNDQANVNNTVAILNGTYSDANWAKGTTPDSLFLFLDDVDHAGHSCCFTVDDEGYVSEIQDVDRQIGDILTAIKTRSTFASEDWQIVITSDHGGRGSTHGIHAADNYTIPFLVASKHVAQGYLAGTPHNYDAAPTVLAHHGITPPAHMDGAVQGKNVIAKKPQNILEDLTTYLSFEGNYQDRSGNALHAQVGGGSPEIQYGGKFGRYVAINGQKEFLTFGNPSSLDFNTSSDFTLMTWYRVSGDQTGDPVILGNKNWQSGGNQGVLLLANEGNGDDFGINIASDHSDRKDIDPIDYTFNGWWLLVATFDRDGAATLYAGSPNGKLFVVSEGIQNVGDITSSLNWNIGQDGTGSYAYNLKADLDDLAIWRRALTLDEVRQIYNQGAGVELNTLLGNTPTTHLSSASDFVVGSRMSVQVTTVVKGDTCGLEWDATLTGSERNAKFDCEGRADPMELVVDKVTVNGSEKSVSGYLVAANGKGALEWDANKLSNERNAKFDQNTQGDYLTVRFVADANATTISTQAYGQECGFEWDNTLLGHERNAKWDCNPNRDTFRFTLLDK